MASINLKTLLSYGQSFNYKLAQYYGFTMDLTSKPYFVLQEEELINACQDRLGRSYEVCSDLFSTGYAIDEEVRLHHRSWGPDSDTKGPEPSGTCPQIPGIDRVLMIF